MIARYVKAARTVTGLPRSLLSSLPGQGFGPLDAHQYASIELNWPEFAILKAAFTTAVSTLALLDLDRLQLLHRPSDRSGSHRPHSSRG